MLDMAAASTASTASTASPTKELIVTDSLRLFLGKGNFQYNPKVGSITELADKTNFYRWEAFLVRCSALSRLAYSLTHAFCQAMKIIDFAPDVINDAISVLEYNMISFIAKYSIPEPMLYVSTDLFSTPGYENDFIVPELKKDNLSLGGYFFPKCGCHMVFHEDKISKINSKKTLYVAFKGSSDGMDFIQDFKSFIPWEIRGMPCCEDADKFATVGKGFYDHMRDEFDIMLKRIDEIILLKGVEWLVITGHSLGGAQAEIMSLILGQRKKKGLLAINNDKKSSQIDISCVSFGAPFVFNEVGRDYYNELLKGNVITFDRVTNLDKGARRFVGTPGSGSDFITSLPTGYSHPGYMATDLYASSKTGRAYRIDEIREIFLGKEKKSVFGKFTSGLKSVVGSGVGELPSDMAFWNLFTRLDGQKEWKTSKEFMAYSTQLTFSWRRSNKDFLKFLFPNAKDPAALGEKELTPAEKEKAGEDAVKTLKRLGLMAKTVPDDAAAAGEPEDGQKGGGYKEDNMIMKPNRIIYQCSRILSKGICHVAYMGIGYLGGLRIIPNVRLGAVIRRKKPVFQTMILIDSVTGMYISTKLPDQQGGTRKKYRKNKKGKNKRNTRKY